MVSARNPNYDHAMDASTRDDYLWLMSEDAAAHLSNAMDAFRNQANVVRLARNLRKDVSMTRAALVMEQAQLRLRAAAKFSAPEKMFFTRRGLEQSTGAGIARYKSARFTDCVSVADVCCGVGGDLIALDQRGDERSSPVTTTGVDADELTASFARHNLLVCGHRGNDDLEGGDRSVQNLRFEEYSVRDLDGLHCDPDRRGKASNYERTVHGSRFEPSLASVFERSTDIALVAVKVAPATPVGDPWPADIEREWIGDRRECKQQVIWRGSQADVATRHRTATCVDGRGTVTRFRVPEEKASTRLVVADLIGDFVYEPHPAVLAAGLGHAIGQPFDLRPVADDVAYLTGTEVQPTPLIRSFHVIETLPLHLRKVKDVLEKLDAGTLEIKRRGVEQTVGDAFMKLKLGGSRRLTVFLTRLRERRMAIVAERVHDNTSVDAESAR